MKRKRLLIPFCIVIVLLLLFGGAVYFMNANTLSLSTGFYLSASNGEGLIVIDNSPISMSCPKTNKEMFGKLSDGDRILILHDGINGSYPGQTGVYAVLKLSEGDRSNISSNVIDTLTAMGWLKDVTLSGGDDTRGNNSFPSDPPLLTVSVGEESVIAWQGTYSWSIDNDDGTGRTVHADSSHPLTHVSSMTPIAVSTRKTALLTFDVPPNQVTVKRYLASETAYDTYDTVPINDGSIHLETGEYLYEITASWTNPEKSYNGTVHYAFYTKP